MPEFKIVLEGGADESTPNREGAPEQIDFKDELSICPCHELLSAILETTIRIYDRMDFRFQDGKGSGQNQKSRLPPPAAEDDWLKKFVAQMKMFGENVQLAAFGLKQLATNNLTGSVGVGSQIASKVIGVLNPAAGAVVGMFGQVAIAGIALADAFIDRGRELKRYSPELSAANARAQVTNIQNDIREANELGPAIAKLTDANTELSATFRESTLGIKKVIVEALTFSLGELEKSIKGLQVFQEANAEGIGTMADAFFRFINGDVKEGIRDLKQMPERIAAAAHAKWQEVQRRRENWSHIMDLQIQALRRNLGNPAVVAPQINNNAAGNLNIPGLMGL